MLSNNRHSITLRILGVRTRLCFGDTSIHSHTKNGKSSLSAVFESIFFYETLCNVLSLTLVARYRFPKADVKVIVCFLVKEREFSSFYLSLHAQKHEKEKKKTVERQIMSPFVLSSFSISAVSNLALSQNFYSAAILTMSLIASPPSQKMKLIFPPLPPTSVTSICTCPWSIRLSTSPFHPSTGHLPVSLTG